MIQRETLFRSKDGEQAVRTFCDRLLMRWGCAVESQFVETSFGVSHALVSGDPAAPPLVALHGHAINATMWYSIAGKLSERYRLYCIDLPGQPGKSTPNILDDDYAQYPQWLGETLDALGLNQVTLLGLSFGGWLTLRYTVENLDRVSRYVALAPAGITPVRWLTLTRALLPALWGDARRATQNIARQEAIEDYLVEAVTLILTHTRSRILLIPKLKDDDLRRLTTPGLFINGTEDVFFHAESSARRMQLVPNTAVHVVEGASHLIPITQAGVILPLVYEFLGVGEQARNHEARMSG